MVKKLHINIGCARASFRVLVILIQAVRLRVKSCWKYWKCIRTIVNTLRASRTKLNWLNVSSNSSNFHLYTVQAVHSSSLEEPLQILRTYTMPRTSLSASRIGWTFTRILWLFYSTCRRFTIFIPCWVEWEKMSKSSLRSSSSNTRPRYLSLEEAKSVRLMYWHRHENYFAVLRESFMLLRLLSGTCYVRTPAIVRSSCVTRYKIAVNWNRINFSGNITSLKLIVRVAGRRYRWRFTITDYVDIP